jgi:hypothetical protein
MLAGSAEHEGRAWTTLPLSFCCKEDEDVSDVAVVFTLFLRSSSSLLCMLLSRSLLSLETPKLAPVSADEEAALLMLSR